MKEAKVKKKLIWIFVLCLFDAVVTDMGIHLGYIGELNPFMNALYQWNRFVFYGCKLLPLLLLYRLYPRIERKKWINRGIVLCLAAYLLVAAYHLFWMGWVLMA